MRLRGAQRRLSAASLLALTTCATVDRDPVDGCQEDADCGPREVCSLAQGNICVPEELPPQAAIGFEIVEGELRVELTGCDPEVTRELGGSELRVQRRSELVNNYSIRATTRRTVDSCGGNECAGECDEQALTCSEPTIADLTLAMASRLGLSDLRVKKTPDGEPPTATFTWPTYESEDPAARAALVLEVTPTAENNTLGSFRRVIAEDAGPELDAVGSLRCQRGLYGKDKSVVRTLSNTPIDGATIEFRYADPIAAPSTVLGTAPSCVDAEDCPQGWACNLQDGRCGLDLTDTLAGSTSSVVSEEFDLFGGYPTAWLYTYCEGTAAPVTPILRDFTVTVTPPTDSGLPAVLYSLEQGFIDPATEGSIRQVEVEGHLCLPDWQPPQAIGFSVVGEPVPLLETDLGVYSCCSTECLPSTEPGAEPTPPPSVDSCSGFARVRFETRWFNPDLLEWLFAGCLMTAKYPDGSNGRFNRDVIPPCEDTGCSVALTPGAADDLGRTYSVAITQPVGSVFQSQRFSVQLDAETTELEPFELLPRVLLRGQINCGKSSNCSATNAVFLAERLRSETDAPDLPGPFFFEARADANGDFVLPLDPGVYVITAYPAIGQPGGPARFGVVDLREDSEMIEVIDGVPNATLSDPLQLDDGILVRVALDGFELSTGVRPLDIGSWKAQSDFPADQFDLNDPSTCYGTDTAGRRRGCTIRRLRPNDATIALLISKRVQFTARPRGGDKCG
ncbi:MAG: hypothetical protein R6X02_00535 [Enhygromyxa sp.]